MKVWVYLGWGFSRLIMATVGFQLKKRRAVHHGMAYGVLCVQEIPTCIFSSCFAVLAALFDVISRQRHAC